MGYHRECDGPPREPPTHRPPGPPGHHHQHHFPPRPCPQNFYYSHTSYKYATVAVLSCGFIALMVIFWKCCRSKGDGRVIAEPTPQEPVKPNPPPYSPSDFDNPPPYHACVPEELHQQFGTASHQMTVSGQNSTSFPTAPPPKYMPPTPTPTHVVNIPENSARY